MVAAPLVLACALAAPAKAPEVRWARGIVDDFWSQVLTCDLKSEPYLGLLTPELADTLRSKNECHLGTVEAIGGRFRGATVEVASADLSPDRTEAVFKGRLSGRVFGRPGGDKVEADFTVRVAKQPGGAWSIRFLKVVEREAKEGAAATPDECAVRLVEQLGGKVMRDEAKPGRPVYLVNLNNTQVADADLERVAALTHLTHLSLGNTRVSDDGLRHLAPLSNLYSLNLGYSRVTGAGLTHLARLPLRDLSLVGPRVSDAGVKGVSALTGLTSLCLCSAPAVTDRGLKHLAPLTQLTSLNLFCTSVSDAGVKHLGALTKLDRLYVWETRVTEAGAARLRLALPNCKVVRTPEGNPDVLLRK
jgi:hypothetical protein